MDHIGEEPLTSVDGPEIGGLSDTYSRYSVLHIQVTSITRYCKQVPTRYAEDSRYALLEERMVRMPRSE